MVEETVTDAVRADECGDSKLLFASIRKGEPINNGEYMTRSTMLAILGRMAAYTGKRITWEEAMQSKEKLGPDTYQFGPLPFPEVAMPGITEFV